MKKLLLSLSLIIALSFNLTASPIQNELPSGYFMVVAAYASSAENFAIKYVSVLKEKGIDANYGFSKSKNMFFVYSASYDTRSEALKSIDSERERTGESKAWVYISENKSNDKTVDTVDDNKNVPDKKPVAETKLEVAEEVVPEPVLIEPTDEVEVEEEIATPVSHQGMTYLFIESTDATTGKPITIEYEVIDLSRNTKIAIAQSQISFALKEPNSASKMIQVQSNDIGWQKQSFDFKYYEPIIDPMSIFLDNLGDTTFVKFEMNPLKKGDLVTLYKVFFFKDAGIMMAKSGYELDQVVALMKNNPNTKIILHGHTNGNAAGKIIALKDHDDVDFFNINGDHRELSGSAVKLSAERASIVGRYLESKGIATTRFEIEGWGGKKMIYDKHSPEARYNVRVEIEVVEE